MAATGRWIIKPRRTALKPRVRAVLVRDVSAPLGGLGGFLAFRVPKG